MKNQKPGFSYSLKRVRNFIRPPVQLLPEPEGVVFEQNVAIPVRDGAILRANVFRPQTQGTYPVIMCAHPYGKDKFNRKGLLGPRFLFQYRVMHLAMPFAVSPWVSWEAPDPAFWVPKGYVLVNIDLRGTGASASAGLGEVMSDQESEDYYDCIEWAAHQPWSNGKVGLNGVSYLAISQYKVAALNPPHLAAICPWEGFSDFYKDWAYPGGIREDGFTKVWGKAVPTKTNVREEQEKRPLRDEWYRSLVPDLKKIRVPVLVCGSFSDQCLHSAGSFRVFNEAGSAHKWLYTHRGVKWAVYYSQEALEVQLKFFDHFLKEKHNGMLEMPPVRLEVMDTGSVTHRVEWEECFPPKAVQWTPFYLNGSTGQLSEKPSTQVQQTAFDFEKGAATFEWKITQDLEVVGPLVLKVFIKLKDATDLNLFAGVRKIRDNRQVVFEGSYGFGYDLVTKGWQKASLRAASPNLSRPGGVEHDYTARQPLQPGEMVELNFSLLPSATFFKSGDILRLDLQGHWFFGSNFILNGPAQYEKNPKGVCEIYSGGKYDSQLLLPLVKGVN